MRTFTPATLNSLRRLWGVHLRDIPIVPNRRLRRPARYVATHRRIEVRPDCLTGETLRNLLIHELAHAAAVELHGTKVQPHGREWNELINKARRARLLDEERHEELPRAQPSTRRYRHTCPVCQFARTANRPVQTWRCPDCTAQGLPGELLIERLGGPDIAAVGPERKG